MKRIGLLFLIPLLLTGCLYPKEKMVEQQTPYKDQIQAVQNAVDQFQEKEGGILPIVTKEAETPIYQKYVVDFKRIVPRFMPEPPPNAFESGGTFQYVLVDVERDPTVKLLDVRMAQEIQELTIRLTAYRQEHGYPPYGEKLSEHVFTLDYQKLGLTEAPTVISPYSQKPLQLVINTEAVIYTDYTPDLYDALQQSDKTFQNEEDIRSLLVEQSDFVPAFSLPYTIDPQTNQPVYLTK
jgi:hypothetical protein